MSRICSQCFTLNEDMAKFCDRCGMAMLPTVRPVQPTNTAKPVCAVCGTPTQSGDLYCVNCGATLRTNSASPASTPHISPATPVSSETETSVGSNTALPNTPDPATRVLARGRLVISGTEIPLPPQTEVTLGRQDPNTQPPWHPDIDLTPYGANDPTYGVSRKHARLYWAGQWTIEDLNSTNGTFVQGQQIAQRTPLRDGEQITLGRLGLTFHIN